MAQYYVDGFVIPIPSANVEKYREIAEQACRLWIEHGALEYRECIGDDLVVKDQLSFLTLAGAKPDETVAFAWITYRDRAHRDEVNAKVMADPRIHEMCKEGQMPFDCTRMAYGGFKSIVAS